ncbi:MAG: Crp/Fnr family transcriptional regulator [Chloroflexi bacterium]|nr:MAG: Crp/Fnr family transcriptional regulator [Chloroflexota bacterium]
METLEVLLSGNPIFSSLNKQEIGQVCAMAIDRRYARGEFIVVTGDDWPYLFLVAEGVIQAVKESIEGRSLIVAAFEAGEIFWSSTFFQPESPSIISIEVKQPARLYLWSSDRLVPFLKKRGEVTWELCRLMLVRMQRASSILSEMAFQPVAGRLARLLIENFEKSTRDRAERDLTLDEMAARIGTTREMVCRLLYRFSDENLIKVTRTEFQLTNRSGLMNLAEGEKPEIRNQ